MSEKVYQLNSDQIGVVNFTEPWILIHLDLEGDNDPLQQFYPSLADGIHDFPTLFENRVLKKWQNNFEGEEKLKRLKNYLIQNWLNPGIESTRELMLQTYASSEFKDKTGIELIETSNDFLASTIWNICLRYNKNHFVFENLHISCKIVDKMLAINFWSKAKVEVESIKTSIKTETTENLRNVEDTKIIENISNNEDINIKTEQFENPSYDKKTE